MNIDIPGYGRLSLSHLVLDYNGTLACDGDLLPGVAQRLTARAANLHIHVVTADTFGKAVAGLQGLPCDLVVLDADGQDVAKRAFVERLGHDAVAAIGNGRNDALMLQTARLGIAVIQEEGAAARTLAAADLVCPHINSALDLFDHPGRLTASLRS